MGYQTHSPILSTEEEKTLCSRNFLLSVVAVLIISMVLTACSSGGGKKKIGLVTDVGGVNDKSFNQSAWAGVQKAATEYGWKANFIESKQPTDYEKNIDQFATEKYDVIVTVGFMMGDATAVKAKQYPKIKFAIIDNSYFPTKGLLWLAAIPSRTATMMAV